MAEAAIRTEQLTKDYGEIRALDSLDLTIEPGSIVGFLGPNGAGKSTTIRLLFDLIRPTSGAAFVFGHDCHRDAIAARSLAGYLSGDLRLYEALTAREMVAYIERLRTRPVDHEYVTSIARRLELDLDRKISTLSKGNRQKVGLLLPFVDRPPLVVLDEPASGLDPLVQHATWEILRGAAAEGACVFFSSHVMSEVEAVCDRAALLRRGKLVAFEHIDDFRGRSLRRVHVTFGDDPPASALDAIDGVQLVSQTDHRATLEVTHGMGDLVRALAQHEVLDLESEPPALDEVILSYYRGEDGE